MLLRKVLAAMALAAALCAVSAAAFAAEEVVGVLDSRRVFVEHPKYKQTTDQIETLARKKQEDVKAAIDKEPDNTKKAQIAQTAGREMAEEEAKLYRPLFDDIEKAIRTVSGAKKITVVLEKDAVSFGGTDITEDVIQELKKMNVTSK